MIIPDLKKYGLYWRLIKTNPPPKTGEHFAALYEGEFGPCLGVMSWFPPYFEERVKDGKVRVVEVPGRFHSWSTLNRTKEATHWMPLGGLLNLMREGDQ